MHHVGSEFELKDEQFKFITTLVNHLTGIIMTEQKRDMIYARLVRRLRILNLDSFEEYCAILEDPQSDEIPNFVNAVTTNLTNFFREIHHFEHLKSVLQELAEHKQKIRIWSAGCSSGQEPYSIAITVSETIKNLKNYDIKILATDIDTEMLEKANNGIYKLEDLKNVPQEIITKYFRIQDENNEQSEVIINPKLRNFIRFNQLNLHGSWPIKGQFNIIFCRNVIIYFDKPTQAKLFEKFASVLEDDGFLYIGHSENITNVCDKFELIGKTIYRKK